MTNESVTNYLIIYEESILISGDETSRLRPSHGYGERRHHYDVVMKFDNEESFKKELLEIETNKHISPKSKYTAYKVEHLSVASKTTVSISIDTKST